jgi:hypothetical protein
MNKRGIEWGMTVFLGLVILIVSLFLLFYFFNRLDLGEGIDKEVCRQSVEKRHIFTWGYFEPGIRFIPLNCETEKICVSDSGNNCDALGFTPDKENKITKVKVGREKNTKSVVMDAISDAMYNCHYQLGEGELNFMPRKLGGSANYCLVCSKIALDEEIREKLRLDGSESITYSELFRHMEGIRAPGGLTNYLGFIYGVESAKDMNGYLEKALEELKKNPVPGIKIDNIFDFEIELGKKEGFVMVSQLVERGYFAGDGVGKLKILFGNDFGLFGKDTPSKFGLSVPQDPNDYAIVLMKDAPKDAIYGYPAIHRNNLDSLRAIGCNEFDIS